MARLANTAQAAEYAAKAFKKMHELRISATPENYAIWYGWAEGADSALVEKINSLLGEKEIFDSTRCDALYQEFVAPSGDEAITNANDQLQDNLARIMQTLESAGSSTEEYQESLSEFSSALSDDHTNANDLQKLVSSLTEKTKDMAEQNALLQEKVNESSKELTEMKQNLADAQEAALTDGLTQIPNRKAFDQTLKDASKDALKEEQPLSLLMMDIDHFKAFNDTHGHSFGDKVLKLVAHTIKQCIKGRDTVARYGGEEFGVILPNTSLENARKLAQTICDTMASKEIVKKGSREKIGSITLSIGAGLYVPDEELSGLINRADKALYAAKAAGRNRVMTEQDRKNAA